ADFDAFFYLLRLRHLPATLFLYTTLFRSDRAVCSYAYFSSQEWQVRGCAGSDTFAGAHSAHGSLNRSSALSVFARVDDRPGFFFSSPTGAKVTLHRGLPSYRTGHFGGRGAY